MQKWSTKVNPADVAVRDLSLLSSKRIIIIITAIKNAFGGPLLK